MKRRVYFVRHGETDWNRERRLQGRTDVPLNRTGIRQAEELAKIISNLKVGAIISSPLKRAAETAEIIAAQLAIPIEYNENLVERCFGVAEGLVRKEIIAKYSSLLVMDGDFIDWNRTVIPGGESPEVRHSRLSAALSEIFADSNRDNVLVVTHGDNVRYLMRVSTSTMNCCCFSTLYDTESGEISDIKLLYVGEGSSTMPKA
ncbi:MAG: histidine phosphatase family protein [Rickettsiales bacterium]|jgi:probable phosphoglycerate mutase|nr:histidine phosphatase family protein [Rickettsiales bacterium]